MTTYTITATSKKLNITETSSTIITTNISDAKKAAKQYALSLTKVDYKGAWDWIGHYIASS